MPAEFAKEAILSRTGQRIASFFVVFYRFVYHLARSLAFSGSPVRAQITSQFKEV